jgi:creatinine amidohydrolase
MDTASSTTPHRQLDGSCYWIGQGLFLQLCEAILAQAARAGFRVIVADGHGPSRHAWGDHVEAWENQFGLRLVSVARDLKGAWRSQMDHAAKNETSLMLALAPTLVEMDQVPSEGDKLPQGTGGVHPREASAEYGEECLAASIAALKAKLAEMGVFTV